MNMTKMALASAVIFLLAMFIVSVADARRSRGWGTTYMNVGDDARWGREYERAREINVESEKKAAAMKNSLAATSRDINAETARAQEDITKMFGTPSK